MLLWHALLFSLLVMSTLAIPVTFDTSDTSDTKGADKPSVGSWLKATMKNLFQRQQRQPDRINGYW